MGGMIVDRELVRNQVGDPAAGPDIAAKAEGFGAFQQQGGELRPLLGAEPRPGTGRRVISQRLGTVQGSAVEPLADGSLGDAEGLRDLLLGPTLLMQFPSAQAATFAPTDGRDGLWCVHAAGPEHFPAHDY